MITASSSVQQMITASAREIDARVELYEGSTSVDDYAKTLIQIFSDSDALKEFTIDRVGEQSKFFGMGVCQKLTVKLLDKDRAINVEKNQILEVAFGVGTEYTYPCPLFRVEEVSRDETNNDLTITAYDFLYKAGEHRVSEIEDTQYTIREFIHLCANILGLPVKIDVDELDSYVFDTTYPNGGNFDGHETFRQALDDVAEATQCIYYVDWDWKLTFKRLAKDALPVVTFDKSQYFSLTNQGNKTLATIHHVTELGDNVYVTDGEGDVQYVRDNAFWELRDDIATLLQNAMDAVGGTSIHQLDLVCRGNWLVEIGDKFAVVTKDNEKIYCYLLNDIITYNGGLKQNIVWSFTENTAETASNPITIGDALNQTYARVDKINKQIDMVVSEVDGYSSSISQLQMTTDTISSSVKRIEQNSDNMSNLVKDELALVTSKVEATMTADDVRLEVSKQLEQGTNKVTTSTGFVFDEEGLTISKSTSNISTQITEDGMTISRNGTEVLTVNNQGVNATNLHATTYLHIGTYSRFEDYNGRTGCFWIA